MKLLGGKKAGQGYEKICKALNLSRSKVKSIITKWRKKIWHYPRHYQDLTVLPNEKARRAVVREVSTRSATTPKDLQTSLPVKGEPVQTSTISSDLHKSGLYEKVPRRKLHTVQKKKLTKAHLEFAKRHVGWELLEKKNLKF